MKQEFRRSPLLMSQLYRRSHCGQQITLQQPYFNVNGSTRQVTNVSFLTQEPPRDFTQYSFQDREGLPALCFVVKGFPGLSKLHAAFRNHIEPLILMAAIPLVGVVWGDLAIGIELSMSSILEFISLAGVVVNNSILLVLFPKSQVATGADVEATAAQASPSVFERSC